MKRILFFLLLLSLCCITVFSFEFYINDSFAGDISPACLQEISYPVSSGGRFTAGTTLLEGLPLFTSVYKMEIQHAFGTERLEGNNLADSFGDWLFLINPDTVDIETSFGTFRRVRGVRIWGEELASKSLSMWIAWEGTTELRTELNRFAELHGLEIDILEVPSIDSKLTSAARSRGTLPDICMVQSDYLPALTESRVLQRLDYLKIPNLLDKGADAFTRDNSLWAVPFYFDTQLVYYNTEILTKMPASLLPSETWTLRDFEHLCAALLQQGTSPITWNAYSAYWLIPFQIGFGKKSVLEADGSIIINDPPTRKALEYIISLQDKGYLDIRERDGMMSRFFSGDVAMVLSGSYSIPEFEAMELPFAIAPYPFNTETGKSISPLLDFKALAITRKTKNPVLSRRLIEYLTGVGVQQRFCGAVSKLSANTKAWKIMNLQNPYYNTLFASYEIGTLIPPEDSYRIYKNTMWKLLRFALTGEMSVEETLSEGQKIINNKLKTRSNR